MGTDQQFCLRWNNFHTNITSTFESLRDDEEFVDITLACEGKQVKAHKMVLIACSPYFRNLLKGNPCQHPIVILMDVTFSNLTSILDFMYHGEVNVSNNDLATFLETAESLKLRGLAEDHKKKDCDGYDDNSSPGPKAEPLEIGGGTPKTDEAHFSDSPPSYKRRRRQSGASTNLAKDTNERVPSDVREPSVKIEIQEFNNEEDILEHHSLDINNIEHDSTSINSNAADENNAASGRSKKQDISRTPAFSLDGVEGLPLGIAALPGLSMSKGGSNRIASKAQEINNQEIAVRYLQDRGILHKHRICDSGHDMKLSIPSDRWRCTQRYHQNCSASFGLRKDTWLEQSRIPLEMIIKFIDCWCKEYTTTKFCINELGLSTESITNWKYYLREVCAHSLLKKPIRIGGEGLHVEIDESCFVRRKNNVGRVYPKQWVCGGICHETNQCFLYAVPDCSAQTLFNVLTNCILPGSIIISDKLKAYEGICNIEKNYKHFSINHSENFNDPTTGEHTNKIESLWAQSKRRNNNESWNLCEFLWRHNNRGKNLSNEIYKDIACFYPIKNNK